MNESNRPIAVRDPVTDKIYAFLKTRYLKIFSDALAHSIQRRSPKIILPSGPFSENRDRAEQNIKKLAAEIEMLCRRNDFARFLLLFRKMPHELAIEVLSALREGDSDSPSTLALTYSEAVLAGTNYMLKFCRHAPSLASNHARYKFEPTDSELGDAARMLALCVIHRHELFRLNTIHRRDLLTPLSFDTLLDVYNRRLDKRWAPKVSTRYLVGIVFPASAAGLPREKRNWDCRDRDGRRRIVHFWNFYPVPCDADHEFSRYAYLDTPDFERMSGITFAIFKTVWLGLNRLLIETLPILWSDEATAQVAPEFLTAKLEQLDDYCESALGGSSAENIAKACHALLMRDGGATPTLDECRAVIDFLTYRQFDGDARFIEQPFVFYPVSPELLFWDYFRHGGLLRCLARQLTRDPNSVATREKKGEIFEAAISAAAGSLSDARGIRDFLLRKDKRSVWDIDIGFVYQDILFLVEAKNEQKNIRYYFEAIEISSRTQGRELLLQKMDDNLKQYLAGVRTNWKDCGKIEGAICVVCTIEAEFIASTDAKLWLDMFTCPRICMLDELMTFLATEDGIRKVRAHPAFVRFETG